MNGRVASGGVVRSQFAQIVEHLDGNVELNQDGDRLGLFIKIRIYIDIYVPATTQVTTYLIWIRACTGHDISADGKAVIVTGIHTGRAWIRVRIHIGIASGITGSVCINTALRSGVCVYTVVAIGICVRVSIRVCVRVSICVGVSIGIRVGVPIGAGRPAEIQMARRWRKFHDNSRCEPVRSRIGIGVEQHGGDDRLYHRCFGICPCAQTRRR
jgi:hypothetical protein